MPSTQNSLEVAARLERDQAERRAALWQAPLLADVEIAEVLGLPVSSWHALKRAREAPRMFRLGRRAYAKTADVRAWLDARAERGIDAA